MEIQGLPKLLGTFDHDIQKGESRRALMPLIYTASKYLSHTYY